MSSYFNQALSNFTNDVAFGGAVRVLADRGFTVAEIKARLDYPVSETKIAEMVWKHYLDTGVIKLEPPAIEDKPVKVTYELEYDSYGKQSYRRVVKPAENLDNRGYGSDYIACDFGKQLYQDKVGFINRLQALQSRDRDYILGLPWPVQRVYHIANERMQRIAKIWIDNDTKG